MFSEQNEEVEAKEERTRYRRFFANLLILVVAICAAFGIATWMNCYVVDEKKVEGSSMEPSLMDGDSVIVEKISYRFRNPKRYEIIVFPVGDDTHRSYYVKRVIGLPGEKVRIQSGKIYIDGKRLEDDDFSLSNIIDGGNATKEILLTKDEYFVLGDNRNRSTDSRSDYVGNVHRKDIVGRVVLCIWPFSRMGVVAK